MNSILLYFATILHLLYIGIVYGNDIGELYKLRIRTMLSYSYSLKFSFDYNDSMSQSLLFTKKEQITYHADLQLN